MNLVPPKAGAKHESLLNKPASLVVLSYLCQTYVAPQIVTKFIAVVVVNLVTPKAGAKHEGLLNNTAS
jgi:hypothetical protein